MWSGEWLLRLRACLQRWNFCFGLGLYYPPSRVISWFEIPSSKLCICPSFFFWRLPFIRSNAVSVNRVTPMASLLVRGRTHVVHSVHCAQWHDIFLKKLCCEPVSSKVSEPVHFDAGHMSTSLQKLHLPLDIRWRHCFLVFWIRPNYLGCTGRTPVFPVPCKAALKYQ
jgi:hypothetical protein